MAKNIKDIFESNPQLLDTPEVKELVSQFRAQFKSLQQQKQDYWNFVTDLLLNSDYYVIDGIKPKEVVSALIKESFK